MIFSSIQFLYVFLPIVLMLYFLAPQRLKKGVLFVSSLLFYYLGEPAYTVLLLATSLIGFFSGLLIQRHRGSSKAKWSLVLSLVLTLGCLAFFKYADFLISTFNGVFGTDIPLPGIPLPLGISFFTFQTISYTIDVYRGLHRADRNWITVATYICLFPQLVAGPIVRYIEVAQSMQALRPRLEEISEGIRRFVIGLGKKVVIANSIGVLCTQFRASTEESVLFFWLYAVGFTLQLYFDFSGYSDMAIGLGHMFSFSFPENFRYPLISRSITEFWRRWHMTLGSWFRDYVYIPLGGNRVSRMKWLRNIVVVWFLTGLWHGAAWNFVVWGLYFALLLILEALFLGRVLEKAGPAISRVYVVFLVVLSFVMFNGDGLSGALADWAGMFGIGGIPLIGPEALYQLRSYGVLLIVAALAATPLPSMAWNAIKRRPKGAVLVAVLEPCLIVFGLLLVTACLVDGSFNPFLYFRF